MIDSTTVDVDWDPSVLSVELRDAVSKLSYVGLKLAAKWLSEQLIGLALEDQHEESIERGLPRMPKMTTIELYAKTLMDVGEYAHVASVLSQPSSEVTVMMPPLANLTSFGIFLRSYALYMAGEQRKSNQDLELKHPLERKSAQHPFLKQLRQELKAYYEQNRLDAFGLYVYGIVLKESLPLKSEHSPHLIFLESIRIFPFNWSAWLDLADLPPNKAIQEQIQSEFASHYMYHFYTAHTLQLNQSHHEAIQLYEKLLQPSPSLQLFCGSPYIASKLAVAQYHVREFGLAQHYFQQIHTRDPYRLEDMDVYSNILYVQYNAIALSQLAHKASRVDKYRPETCCIVGNYYSLKNMRTKAITYFQRALKLDPNYTGAWTLMGHEYIECKNTPAAMEAYREAASLNQKDYRAWYGLGQAYELLGMPLYALYYYRKACSVRSYDPRMWSAVAGCYQSLGKRQEAILSYEKAMQEDVEGIATTQLATLYKQDGKTEQAAQCYRKHLELRYLATTSHPSQNPTFSDILQGVVVQQAEASALLFLAHYHQSHHQLETAALCASRLLEYPGPEKEEGKAVLREIRSRTSSTMIELVPTPARTPTHQEARQSTPRDTAATPSRDTSGEFSVDFSP